jgi:peroxiredoxin family protein
MSPEKPKDKFVIFAHSGTYDRLHQVATLALTASAMGQEVYIILFFWALKKFYSGELDKPDFPEEHQTLGKQVSKLMGEKKVPKVSEMLREGKSIGRVKIIICSAGLEYMDIEKGAQPELVDEVWGLPTVLSAVKGAATILYI